MRRQRDHFDVGCRWPAAAVVVLVLLYGSGLIKGVHLWLGHARPRAAAGDAHQAQHAQDNRHQHDHDDGQPPATPHHHCDICVTLASMRADMPDPAPPVCLSDLTHYVQIPIEPLVLERLLRWTISSRGPPTV